MTHSQTEENPQSETGMLAASVALQAQGLALLLAEMRGLAALMTGARADGPAPTEAEREADFDNLPV